MGCFHGHAIADCPDRRCQGQENTQDDFDVAVSRLATIEADLRDALSRLDQYVLGCACPGMPCVTACPECDKTQGLVNRCRANLR